MRSSQAPEILEGQEGELVFVRADLALSATHARGVALTDGYNLSGFEVDLIEMLPVPDHFVGMDADWWPVRPGTPDAVSYWRFQL